MPTQSRGHGTRASIIPLFVLSIFCYLKTFAPLLRRRGRRYLVVPHKSEGQDVKSGAMPTALRGHASSPPLVVWQAGGLDLSVPRITWESGLIG
jgi:hypothetical protein